MRLSRFPLATLKETPADAEVISHQLMLRAGLIRRLAAGLYTWLPLGLRVLRKVERIVREEMDRAGALELLMPAVQPAELWQESGRWDHYGPELLRLKDRHGREFCFGPTHEEVITDLARKELRSYKQLPVTYYQIQTKFRDEIRPRFGIMRAREFLMKDAYSFHIDAASLQETYEVMHAAYSRIFTRLGLDFRAVQADTGSIGGSASHEFHVLAGSGEDAIASCDRCDYAANTELARSRPAIPVQQDPEAAQERETPGIQTVAEQAVILGIDADRIAKSVVVIADGEPAVLFICGDDELNLTKAMRALAADELRLAEADEAHTATGAPRGFIGPKGLPDDLRILVDHRAAALTNFSSGANRKDWQWINLNWGRDVELPPVADLRDVHAGEGCPDCEGSLQIGRGIEVGHIFQLGDKYSRSMGAQVLDENGREQVMSMGCYGIGVSRVVAAAIEQNHDERGIIWPAAIAPFHVAIVPMNMHKSARVADAAQELYAELTAAGLQVILDDRGLRPGVMFAEMELTGIPHRIVIGERGLTSGNVEYQARTDSESRAVPRGQITALLLAALAGTDAD